MNTLREKIQALEAQSEVLDPSESQFRQWQEKVTRFAQKFYAGLSDFHTYRSGEIPDPDRLQITATPTDLDELLDTYQTQVAEIGISPASGGHFGYVPGGGLLASAWGDFLASLTNEYVGVRFASPGGVQIEDELIKWLKEVFGFPTESLGTLTSGGSIANLIALTSARDKFRIKGDKIARSVVYLSDQTHHCIHKALRIIGLEDVIIRNIELDGHYRMIPELLESQISADIMDGLNPFLVVASAGTTNTGSLDPLQDIGQITRRFNLWYHIDGAYGGFFILTDSKKPAFAGVEMADSLVVDPHKTLFLPFGIGAVLIRDQKSVFHSHFYTASYMQDTVQEGSFANPADVSPELTRHFRAMRMWIPLQLYGIAPFKACLEEKLLLVRYMREQFRQRGFAVGPEPDLSISYFWYPSEKIDQNRYNLKLLEYIHADGRVFFSSTVLNERFVIRIAVVSFRTKLFFADRAIQVVMDAKEKTDRYFESHLR